ncbi:DUF3800 domain-containing protein [Bacillus subtilis]|uniref:DUF3800 domain-containing protein n=2 Tax=Bacillus subtilis TaxID=1423 RepID=A0ABD3ZRY4_BACIU|nr:MULTISPECIES: DUF3800 domain-containing protein [Bacillus]AYK55922.1 hypothetical protein D9C10_01220 [Bacillus subtilis subsp. subtilis]KIL30744.1 hypothetical protein B4067_4773 [Bacillus subtilis subsp. subtilis]KIN26921.1 hypothetical protein B4069_0608 [Bacillus subtilis]KIN34464.1 hypothetical protein B4068_0587 [Bacillus subtilis]KIN37832.1 hypothetical protein B4070_0642 [Bacillus subtilis]
MKRGFICYPIARTGSNERKVEKICFHYVICMDYSYVREAAINFYNEINGEYLNFDEKYHFFYDETNNIRKYSIKNGKLSYDKSADFVLGGIVLSSSLIDINNNFRLFKEQVDIENGVELKLTRLSTGKRDFLGYLSSTKVTAFFDFLLKENIYVHYAVLDNFFFSLVDIIDSSVFITLLNVDPNFLKTLLYVYAYKDTSGFLAILWKYGYPNIYNKNVESFCLDLIKWLDTVEGVPESYSNYIDYLKKFLFLTKDTRELVFLQGNPERILIENYVELYTRPIYMFKNSFHTFDSEKNIEKIIKIDPIVLYGDRLSNFEFINKSEDNIFIQLSDVFVGLLGKMLIFLNELDIDDILEVKGKLNKVQSFNLELLSELLLSSFQKNPVFKNFPTNLDIYYKTNLLIGYKS